MYRQERYEEPSNALQAAITGRLANVWTALPGIVLSYNAKDNTVEVQPATQSKRRLKSGQVTDETIPKCVDVPVHFPSAGGYALTFPVKKGDECLLIFSKHSIDNWWDKGDVRPQSHPTRQFNLSDGFAIIGTRSQKNALKEPSTDTVQLRSEDGKTLLEIDAHQTIRLVATTKIRMETPVLEVTGTIKAGADVQANAVPSPVRLSWSPSSASRQAIPTATSAAVSIGAQVGIGVPGILTVSADVDTLIGAIGDKFEISGAINMVNQVMTDPISGGLSIASNLVPGASDFINGIHTVTSIIDSRNFTALLSLAPGQIIGQIAGIPMLGAIVHLLSHDHHGVRAGIEISQRPVTGT
jgi:hypothetical protein